MKLTRTLIRRPQTSALTERASSWHAPSRASAEPTLNSGFEALCGEAAVRPATAGWLLEGCVWSLMLESEGVGLRGLGSRVSDGLETFEAECQLKPSVSMSRQTLIAS